MLILAALFGVAGLIRPGLLRPIFVGWMVMVFPIGWLMSRVLLGVLFYGLFTPLAIAFRLGISEHTVKFHVTSIMAKLDAGSRTEAVTLGIRQGLVML